MNDFDRHTAELRQEKARMGRDFEETKREMARSRQRFEKVVCGVAVIVCGILLFGCWCVYHVLKAKGLVP